jgi:uncharacterized membrane protein YdjX (TVP38/TMEM64 family)
MMKRHVFKLVILGALIATGIALQLAGFLNPQDIVPVARQYADHWWLMLILVLVQVVLFTFALAGSVILWAAATLYPPIVATTILALGATLGGISAYFFSARLTEDWVQRVQHSRIYKILRQEDNFFTLFAMRVMPAFPHALVNYSSGMLRIRLAFFVPAAFLGISIKSYIYAQIIYNATSTAALRQLLDISVYGPLVLLSVVTMIGVLIRNKWSHRKERQD